jgi:hypothetical protein
MSWLAHTIAGHGAHGIYTHRDDISLTLYAFLSTFLCLFSQQFDTHYEFVRVHHSGYLLSLYWCLVTLASVGYGDITPVTKIEIAFTCLTIMLGSMSFGYIIGNGNTLCGIITKHILTRPSSPCLASIQ